MFPGLVMACLCAIYLVVNRWLKYGKELMGGILYTSGVLLPALALNYQLTTVQWILVVQFVLIVLINMLLFARMDYETDLLDRQRSFVTTAGLQATTKVIGALFGVFGVTALLMISENYFSERLVLGVMASMLLLIFLFPDFFRSEERYRFFGDGVFLLPAFLLAFD
jgi:4-hydroxybenzoate polyprenyltransferase